MSERDKDYRVAPKQASDFLQIGGMVISRLAITSVRLEGKGETRKAEVFVTDGEIVTVRGELNVQALLRGLNPWTVTSAS